MHDDDHAVHVRSQVHSAVAGNKHFGVTQPACDQAPYTKWDCLLADGDVVAESDCTVRSKSEATCGSLAIDAGGNVSLAIAQNGVDFVPLATEVSRNSVNKVLLLYVERPGSTPRSGFRSCLC